MTSFIEYLKECPDCLYIYNRDYSIYGLPEQERYTIVVKDNWVIPEEFQDELDFKYEIYKISEWFDVVLNGSLMAWECACLNKKYVIKEHVKLMMSTNPLQLRKYVDALIAEAYESIGISYYWDVLKAIRFATQIIEHHKIVNFKEPLQDFNALNEKSLDEVMKEPYNKLKSLTDGMLKKEILDRIKKKNDSNI